MDKTKEPETKQKQEIRWIDDWCEPVGEMPPITKEDLEPQTKEDDSATL